MEFTWKVLFWDSVENIFDGNHFAGEVLCGDSTVYTADPAHWVRVAQCNNVKIHSITLIVTEMPYSVEFKIEAGY